jgi:uncharacterized DUF497 family protein
MNWQIRLGECEGFQWFTGNLEKVWERHRLAPTECEELFLNQPLVVSLDEKHSETEERLYALGKIDAGRMLFFFLTTPTPLKLTPHPPLPTPPSVFPRFAT